MLRLPLEVRDLFKEWLMANYPDRFRHVMKLVREMRGGKDYDSTWGKRQTGDRPLCLADRAALRGGLRAARAQPGTSEAHHRAFPEAGEGQRAAEFVLAVARSGDRRTSECIRFHVHDVTSMPHAHISLVTLGVTDVPRAARFYEALGFKRKMRARRRARSLSSMPAPLALSLYVVSGLARDAGFPPDTQPPAFRGSSLAWNCDSEAEVDAVMALALKAGATELVPAKNAAWGGYHGHFADPGRPYLGSRA